MNNDRFKFRVWDKINKKYVFFNFFSYLETRAIEIGLITDISWSSCNDNLIDKTYHLRQNDIIEQCTGLKDKNGTLIYEGDIVKDWFGKEYIIRWCFNVEYRKDDGFAGFTKQSAINSECEYMLMIETLEIIGNIHKTKDASNE